MQQTGSANAQANIDIEKLPQFQEEWRKIQVQLDQQYEQLLEGYKDEIKEIQ